MGLPNWLVLPLIGAGAAATAALATAERPPVATASESPAAEETVVVYKSPTCGCCGAWEDHLRASGFRVDSRPTTDMAAKKQALGVPADLASCHTAVVGDYVVEGHVPADAIERLLLEAPDARGLFVPGMPLGSPGMEVPSGETQPYDVVLVGDDGGRTVFDRID